LKRATLTFLQAWSLPRNLASFSRKRPEDSEVSFAALDGLRVLSTLWVILGHTVIWPLLSIGYDNSGMILPPHGRLTELWFQIVPGGYFAVDTFFWLSGMLGAHSLHAKVQRSPSLLSPSGFCLRLYPMGVLTRWLRLTMVYAFVLLFTQTWYRELGRGGLLWGASTTMGSGGMGCASSIDNDACKTYWWAQLLYVSNIVKADSCMAWTWYLACDMQMFLVLPFLVLIRERAGKFCGWSVLAVLTLASVAANLWVISSEKLVSDPVLGNFGGKANFMADVYEVSWMRAQPYLIGVGTAWLLDTILARGRGGLLAGDARSVAVGGLDQELGAAGGTGPQPLLSPDAVDERPRQRHCGGHGGRGIALALGLQLMSFALMAFVVFVPVTRYRCSQLTDCMSVDKAPWSPIWNALYGSLNHSVWALGLACLMLLCFLRAPGTAWVNCLLGAEFWQAPVKLTYSAYLLHPLVLVFFYCQNDTSLQYLDATLVSNFVAFSTVVFLLSFVVWLFVEKPMANVCAQLLGSIAGKGGGAEA